MPAIRRTFSSRKEFFANAAESAQPHRRPGRPDGKLYLSLNSTCYLRRRQPGRIWSQWSMPRPVSCCTPGPWPAATALCGRRQPGLRRLRGQRRSWPWTRPRRTRTVIAGLHNAAGMTVDDEGPIYVAVRDPDNQVKVYSPEGKLLRAIGRPGGRRLLAPGSPTAWLSPKGSPWMRPANFG